MDKLKFEGLYSLEHSQYSENKGMFPFRVGPFDNAVEHNLQDYYQNNREENKWQIIYVGTFKNCINSMNALIERGKREGRFSARTEEQARK